MCSTPWHPPQAAWAKASALPLTGRSTWGATASPAGVAVWQAASASAASAMAICFMVILQMLFPAIKTIATGPALIAIKRWQDQ